MALNPGTILHETWQIKKVIGKGTFSSIYIAKTIAKSKYTEDEYVAIKVQNGDVDSSVLRWESDVLRTLSQETTATVPRFIFSNTDCLVMELMSGEDMSALRNRVRSNSPSGLIPVPVVAYLCLCMLQDIRFMHSKGYIHRDVKPSNFVRKSPSSTQFCIIDFGITKQILDRDGNIRPEKSEKAEFRGTTQYASPFVHIYGAHQCRRDDLFSLTFVMMDMLCGQLPWTAATKAKDKPAVIELKRKYLEDTSLLVSWIVSTMATANQRVAVEDATTTLSEEAQKGIQIVFDHLKCLEYVSQPNYDVIAEIFTNMQQPELHDVSKLDYTCGGFNWKEGVDKRQFLSGSSSVPAAPTTVTAANNNTSSSAAVTAGAASKVVAPAALRSDDPQAVICHKLQKLLTPTDSLQLPQQQRDSESLSQQLKQLPQSDWELARQFRGLVKELLELPERKISREAVQLVRTVLQRHHSFFTAPLRSQEEGVDDWNEFADMQNIFGGFYELYSRVYKRPREVITISSMERGTTDATKRQAT
mmetsp:Transcript_30207/g.43154  ORF Transcript_30207/g.43154 Transcript_30207/m.43154 type:complete len:530 (+) Transcript_30207:22-1611(+)